MRKKIHPKDGILVTRHLTKQYNGGVVLDNISLAIEEGKTTVVIGPSGCGKTVFMKHLIALERPTSGKVFYRGKRIDNLDEQQYLLNEQLNLNYELIFFLSKHFQKQ